MRTDHIGFAYIKDAKIIEQEARESLDKGHYHRTVRKCQEAVELALKGLLRLVSIEYPKSHRVGTVLLESGLKNEVRLEDLKKIAEISDELARERETAFYGTDEGPAGELFTEADAKEALDMAAFIMNFIDRLLKKHKMI
ncbi:MAG: HEPN domain-containing protein [Nitrospirae bacterium]|nr:HEPN domain-containing protein [Nitrospirota bacterium]